MAGPLEDASAAVAKDEATGWLRLHQARAHESDAGQLQVHLGAAALVVQRSVSEDLEGEVAAYPCPCLA